ncbi:hypothetical protein AVEN_8083-1 [Araneus ventricosus]|uniref:Uncharacterized protein n=1 Tax=Araneus ventricosus TaxID=182803 RepID=A0A4Y2RJG8_ARAVE|nr:hypothetical protein AVEN_8083-1 [Araneus ventricosus]
MAIGTVNMLTTNTVTKTLKRKMIKQKSKFQPQKGRKVKLNVLTSPESSLPGADDIFQRQSQASTSMAPADKPITKNSTVDYTLLSRTCDRYGVSDRAGAAITTVVLHCHFGNY